MFKKGNLTGNTKTVRGRIIAAITLVFTTIAKKNAQWNEEKLGSLNSGQKGETSTIESA